MSRQIEPNDQCKCCTHSYVIWNIGTRWFCRAGRFGERDCRQFEREPGADDG